MQLEKRKKKVLGQDCMQEVGTMTIQHKVGMKEHWQVGEDYNYGKVQMQVQGKVYPRGEHDNKVR